MRVVAWDVTVEGFARMSRGWGWDARGTGRAGRAGRGTPWTLGMSRRLVVSFTSALFSAQLAPRREAVLVTASVEGVVPRPREKRLVEE